MIMTGIYKIQSITHPERYYIGSAVNIDVRWRKHKSDLVLNKHHSPHLQRHYNKYGIEDLQFSIILNDCQKNDLTTIENTFLKPLPYFNCSPTAGSNLGFKQSKGFCERNRKRMIGNTINNGRHHSEEYKEDKRKRMINNKYRLGLHPSTELKKGNIPWNKGLKMPFKKRKSKKLFIHNHSLV